MEAPNLERVELWQPHTSTPMSSGSGQSGWSGRCGSRPRTGVTPVAQQLGVNPETLRNWVNEADVDDGQRFGVPSDERAGIAELERENRELRRANEILEAASAFFARELDPRLPRS